MPKVWLVTGSSRGLGRQIAEAVLGAGDQLVATARNPQHLADLVAKHPDRVRTVALDVTDQNAAYAAVSAATNEFGRLDVLVNNAGQADFGSVEDTPPESFRRQVDTVFGGVVNVTRAALPAMRNQHGGRIIQVSSMGARMGTPGLAAYQAAKAAVSIFSLALAKEVAHLGITVTVIEPGDMRTDMTSTSSMNMLPVSDDYRSSLDPVAQHLRDGAGRQPGDPVKAAAVILQLAEMVDPPGRLPLGSDAVHYGDAAAQELAASDRPTRSLSRAIDFA